MPRASSKKSGRKRERSDQPKAEEPEIIDVSCSSVYPPKGYYGEKMVNVHMKRRQGYQDLIHVVEDFFTQRECTAWIEYGERYGFTEAFHLASADLAHRDNGRIQFHSDEIAAEIFNRVKVMLPETFEKLVPAGCSSNIRLYRYIEGQRFGKHVDESHDGENGERSVFTLLIYLNHEGLRGGETVFYKGNYGDKLALSYAPRAGSLLLHGHGSRCMVHEGKAVIEGQKYVLRTDVMYRRPKS